MARTFFVNVNNMPTFFNNNGNMPTGYPGHTQHIVVPVDQQELLRLQQQQQLQHERYIRLCQYQHHLRQQNQQQYQIQRYQQQCQHQQQQYRPQPMFQQGGYPYTQQPFEQPQQLYRQAQFPAQNQYQQQFEQFYSPRQQQFEQQIQCQLYQQQQQLDFGDVSANLTFNNTFAQHEFVQSAGIGTPMGHQEPQPAQQQPKRQNILPPAQEKPNHYPLVGATREVPIQIDDEVEVLTEVSRHTPPSQQGEPKTPPVQESPLAPAHKKPENSFFSEAYGTVGKDGKVKRLSIEQMARNNCARITKMAKNKGLTAGEIRDRIEEEDKAKGREIGKKRKAKKLGLANHTEKEEEKKEGMGREEKALLAQLNAELEGQEKQQRPASLKRKSPEIDDDGSSDSEPATKMIRIGSQQEQIRIPVTSTSAPILTTEGQDVVVEGAEALYDGLIEDEVGDEVKAVPVTVFADLDIDEYSNNVDSPPLLRSVERLLIHHPITPEPEPVSSRGKNNKAKTALPRRKQSAKPSVETLLEAQSLAPKRARRLYSKKAKKPTPPHSPSASPPAAYAEHNTQSQKEYSEEEIQDLTAFFHEENEEENEAKPEVVKYTPEQLKEFENMFEENEDPSEPVAEATESIEPDNAQEDEHNNEIEPTVEVTESLEPGNAQRNEDMDSLFDSDCEEGPIERHRSPSVESDEDEDENFAGNLKYRNL